MTVVSGLTGALKQQDAVLKTDTKNVEAAGKPGAVRRVMETVHDGRGGIKHVELRASSEFAHKSLLSHGSEANSATVFNRYAGEIDNVFGDVTSDTGFTSRLNSSFTRLQALTTSGSVSSSAVISELEGSATVIQDTATGLFDLSRQVEEELTATLSDTNALITQIYNNNRDISNATTEASRLDLQDARDDLLNKLSESVKIDVSYAADGQAYVRSMGQEIVGKYNYGQFNYAARGYSDLTRGVAAADMTMVTVHSNGKTTSQNVDASLARASSGSIAGLIQTRDDALPAAIDSVNAIAKTVIENANAVHNKFASLGNTSLEATKAMAASDFVQTSGKVRVSVVNKDGTAIEAGGDMVRHVDVDLGKIHSLYGEGQASVADLMAEIAGEFRHDSAVPTVSMGAIDGHAGQNLLNDIQIVGTQNIATNGAFTFDLELDNSSYFGSTVEILSAEVWSAAGKESDAENVPSQIDLNAGEKTRAGAAVKVTLPAAESEIRLKVRVIGDNGQVEEGTVAYTIPTVVDRTALMNKRLKGTPEAANPGSMAARPDNMPTLLQTKMVDSSGNVVTDTSVAAHAVLETISDEYNIVIEDLDSKITSGGVTQGFGHFFGFNDLFAAASTSNPALDMSIVSSILENPDLLASTHLQSHKNIDIADYVEGDVAASQTITFATDGNEIVAGDTITIGSEVFTFIDAGVPTDNQISIVAGNWATTIQNIITQTSAHPNLQNLVSIEANGADGIKITAVHAGESGNTIALEWGFTTSLAAARMHGNVDMSSNENDFLANGSNKPATNNTISKLGQLGWGVAPGNDFVTKMADFGSMHIAFAGSDYVKASNSTTLSAVIARTQQAAVTKHADATRTVTVAKATLENLAESFDSKYGIDKDAVWAQTMEHTQYRQMLTAMIALLQRSEAEMIRTLSAA